jgi:hypothetical protein
MEPVKIGTSWRIRNEWGTFEGWYMTKEQAERGIEKRIRDRFKSSKDPNEADRAFSEWEKTQRPRVHVISSGF